MSCRTGRCTIVGKNPFFSLQPLKINTLHALNVLMLAAQKISSRVDSGNEYFFNENFKPKFLFHNEIIFGPATKFFWRTRIWFFWQKRGTTWSILSFASTVTISRSWIRMRNIFVFVRNENISPRRKYFSLAMRDENYPQRNLLLDDFFGALTKTLFM